jgi:Uma2 family endonuclease
MSTPLAERELLNSQPRHRWNVAEYHRMGEVGLLNEDSRVELIDGEIIEMAPIGSFHGGEVKYFNNKFVSLLSGKVIVSVQVSSH